MTIVALVLAGGSGTRFSSYDTNPKPLIKVLGRTQLFWATKGASLSYAPDSFIFACRSELVDRVRSEVKTFDFLSDFEVLDVGSHTDGPAHTVELALSRTKKDLAASKIVVVDNDCFNLVQNELSEDKFPFVTTTNSQNPAHCFVELSENNIILAFHEKSLRGDIVVSGNYAFASPSQFLDSVHEAREDLKGHQELYMSSIMDKLSQVTDVQALQVSRFFSLGTPSEVSEINHELMGYQ